MTKFVSSSYLFIQTLLVYCGPVTPTLRDPLHRIPNYQKKYLIQHVSGTGTNYYHLGDSPGTAPVYRSVEREFGDEIIVFQDPNHVAGEGHYVILRKIPTFPGFQAPTVANQLVYERFKLDLLESFSGSVSEWRNPNGTDGSNHFVEPTFGQASSVPQQQYRHG